MLPFYTALGLLPKGHVDMRVVCSAPITALRTKHLQTLTCARRLADAAYPPCRRGCGRM